MTAEPSSVTIVTLGGLCPVQGEGLVGDKPFYFRARGESWSIGIGGHDPVCDPEWHHAEWYGEWPDAGYMPEEIARACIHRAARRYLAGKRGGRLADDEARVAQYAAKLRALFDIRKANPEPEAGG